MFDENEKNPAPKKYRKNNPSKVSKIEKIKKYYENLNKNPEKVSQYAKRKAIEILSMSDKSRFEIEEKIFKNIEREKYENLVSDILDSIEEMGYLNDERFVENYIRIKFNSGFGKNRIKQELKQKNVDMFLFEEFIENYDFNESLNEYIDRKFNIKEDTLKNLNKIYQKLVLRGFEYSKVKECFSHVEIIKEVLPEKHTSFDNEKFLEKMTKKGYGLNKIRQESKVKGYAISQEEFDRYDFYELAENYKVKKYGEEKETDLKLKQKQINHMLGRGFSYDEIKECV